MNDYKRRISFAILKNFKMHNEYINDLVYFNGLYLKVENKNKSAESLNSFNMIKLV